MGREVICPKHGPYDYRLGGCPECERGGQAEDDERTRVISGPDVGVGSVGDLGPEAPRRGASGGEDTASAGRGANVFGSPRGQTPADGGRTQVAASSAWGQPRPPQRQDAESTMVIRHEAPTPTNPLAWLAVVDGPGAKPRSLFSLKAETLIGRGHGDVVLSGDPKISGQHAKIRLEPVEGEDGGEAYILYDLASANGTYVGTKESCREEGSRVYRRRLNDNEYLLMGETTLVFKQVAD